MHSAHATVDRALQSQREKMVTVLQRQRQKSLKRAVFQGLQQRMQVSEMPVFESLVCLHESAAVHQQMPACRCKAAKLVCTFSGMHPVA